MKAEQAVETTRATAMADREKQIALISASREAEQKAIAVKVAAEAEKEAATNRAAAVKIKAEADRVAFEVEATGKRLINDAINVLSSDQIGLQVKLALIQSLPAIIEKSVEPMKQIDGIKIIQVDGLTRPHAPNGGARRRRAETETWPSRRSRRRWRTARNRRSSMGCSRSSA